MPDLPTLDEMLTAQFAASVLRYTNALRYLADRLDQVATTLGTTPGLRTQPFTAGEVVCGLQHEIEWGLANASFSSVLKAAYALDTQEGTR